MYDPFSIPLTDLAAAGLAASKMAAEEAKDAKISVAGLLKKRRQRLQLKARTVIVRSHNPLAKRRSSRLSLKRGHIRLSRKLRSAGVRAGR